MPLIDYIYICTGIRAHTDNTVTFIYVHTHMSIRHTSYIVCNTHQMDDGKTGRDIVCMRFSSLLCSVCCVYFWLFIRDGFPSRSVANVWTMCSFSLRFRMWFARSLTHWLGANEMCILFCVCIIFRKPKFCIEFKKRKFWKRLTENNFFRKKIVCRNDYENLSVWWVWYLWKSVFFRFFHSRTRNKNWTFHPSYHVYLRFFIVLFRYHSFIRWIARFFFFFTRCCFNAEPITCLCI